MPGMNKQMVAKPIARSKAKAPMKKKNTPNAAKIPNVCDHFGIPCVNLEGFMAKEKWEF